MSKKHPPSLSDNSFIKKRVNKQTPDYLGRNMMFPSPPQQRLKERVMPQRYYGSAVPTIHVDSLKRKRCKSFTSVCGAAGKQTGDEL